MWPSRPVYSRARFVMAWHGYGEVERCKVIALKHPPVVYDVPHNHGRGAAENIKRREKIDIRDSLSKIM